MSFTSGSITSSHIRSKASTARRPSPARARRSTSPTPPDGQRHHDRPEQGALGRRWRSDPDCPPDVVWRLCRRHVLRHGGGLCEIWQNPDLDDLTITNVGAAYAVTSGLTWAAYAAPTSAPSPVRSRTPTPRPRRRLTLTPRRQDVKKHSDFADSPPWTGDLIALEAGDITEDGRHCFEWNEAGDCWILLNPGRSWRNSEVRGADLRCSAQR